MIHREGRKKSEVYSGCSDALEAKAMFHIVIASFDQSFIFFKNLTF